MQQLCVIQEPLALGHFTSTEQLSRPHQTERDFGKGGNLDGKEKEIHR